MAIRYVSIPLDLIQEYSSLIKGVCLFFLFKKKIFFIDSCYNNIK